MRLRTGAYHVRSESLRRVVYLEEEDRLDGIWWALVRSGLLKSTTKELGNANLSNQRARDAFQYARVGKPQRLSDTWYDTWRAQTRLEQAFTAFKKAEKNQKLLDANGISVLPR